MRTLRYDLPFCSSATLMTQLSRKQHAANWRGVFVDYICRYMDSVLKKIIKKFVLISIGLTSPHSCWFNKLTLFILETMFFYQDQYENSFLLQVIFTKHFRNCPRNAVYFREETSMHFGVQFYVPC